MVGYSPSGISYGEGQMPLGLGAASGICDHGYCPQEGEGVEINPREVPTSPFAVRWDGFNWDTMDDDVNIFQPTDCLAKQLAGDESSCCEKGTEPCDKWGHGGHPHKEMRPYPIPPPVPKVKAKHRLPRAEEVPAPGWSANPFNIPYIRGGGRSMRDAPPPAEPAPAAEEIPVEGYGRAVPEEEPTVEPKESQPQGNDFTEVETYPGEWEADGELIDDFQKGGKEIKGGGKDYKSSGGGEESDYKMIGGELFSHIHTPMHTCIYKRHLEPRCRRAPLG